MPRLSVCTVMFMFCSALGLGVELQNQGTVSIMRDLNAPYTIKRIEAIRKLVKINNKAQVQDFKVVEVLLKIAKDNLRNSMERKVALQTLVNLSSRRLADPALLLYKLKTLIGNKDIDLETRIDALQLIASLGKVKPKNVDEKDLIKKVYKAIEEIASAPRQRNALRCMAYRAIGSMAGKKAETILLGALRLNKTKVDICTSVLAGMKQLIDTTGNNSAKLFREILSFAKKQKAKYQSEVRVMALNALASLIANGVKVTNDKDFLEFLAQRMDKGSDEEMITASQCMLRFDNPLILSVHFKEFNPAKRKPPALKAIVMGIIELYRPLARKITKLGVSKKNKDDAREKGAKITMNLSSLVGNDSADLQELRRIAAMGLGAIPRVFSREFAVEGLVKALGAELAKEKGKVDKKLVAEIERSLMQIGKLDKKFRSYDGKIEIDKWESWLENNRSFLQAGKSPWDKESKDYASESEKEEKERP